MSSKTAALVRLYTSIAVFALPGLAVAWASAGYARIGAAISLAGLSIACVWHAYQEAISKLSDSDGNSGGGTTTSNSSTAPKTPPASPFRVMPAFVCPALALAVIVIGCSWFKANGPTVITDVAQITNCIIAAIDAGNPDGGAVDLTAVATTCGASTVDDVIQILDQTLAKEQGAAEPNQARIVKLKALGADASRAKLVGDGGAR